MAKQEYGVSPWGEWFLSMLSSYDDKGRLSRGKSYANTGKVSSLIIKSNSVGAKVKGRYAPWYHIYFKFPPITKTNEKKLRSILEKNPLELTALKSGIMNQSLIDILKAKGVRLIPAKWNLIQRECSCPDYGDPCKHMSAVLFILAKEIDHDPRLLFNLVGFDINSISINKKETEQGETQEINESNYAIPIPLSLQEKAKTESRKKLSIDEPLKYEIGESYISLITNILPREPNFTSPNFFIKLTEFYHKAIIHYSYNFYNHTKIKSAKNDDENEKAIDPFLFSKIKVNTDNLESNESSFPLKPNEYLTLSINLPEEKEINLSLLQGINLFTNKSPHPDMTESCKLIFSFYSLAGKLIQDSAFIPSVLKTEKNLHIFWKVLSASTEVKKDIERFAEYLNEDFFAPVKIWSKQYCAEILLMAFLTEFVSQLKFFPKKSLVSEKEIDDLFFSLKPINIKAPGKRNLPTVIYSWLSVLNYSNCGYEYRLELKQTKDEKIFLLSALVRKESETPKPFVKLNIASKKMTKPDKILQFPATLSAYFPAISKLASKANIPISWEDTSAFMQNSAKLLQRFGIDIVLPKQLKNAIKPKAVVKMETVTGAGNVVSFLNIQDMLSYDRSIMLGDTVISLEEFKKLFSKKSGLVKFNDQFLLLDPEALAKMFETIEKPLTKQEALQAVFSDNAVYSKPVKKMLDKVFKETNIATPKNLQAELRPYQKQGFNWLYTNIKSGFGCLLADDMGLGKTIQIISLILTCKNKKELNAPVLIIAPASLLSNWEHEIEKFAPELSTCIYHGYRRKFLETVDIIITTYQTMQKDIKKIKDRKLSLIILDEAQAIKNSGTKKAKAVKLIKADARIALTGTPVENNLEDMRSIFDFFLPDYLGTADEFRKKWRIPIELHNDQETAERLQKITSPFLLRRLKTEPKVISDLPEKIITNQYCNLTPEQLALYENLVNTELQKIEKTKKQNQRSSEILKLLTELKQVCNHPYSYDKESSKDVSRSGKALALVELLKEILEAGEKTLIFSQFVGTLKILQDIIKKELGVNCLMLNGQMTAKQRKKSVELFQEDPAYRIFLISLKAGGTGLNLTSANRVIHYDLWYNPAVEDQATDRAFRIGQTKNVFVHRFICSGTFEEKVDEMIQTKRQISDMSISSGETWISKMSDEELKSLFKT